MLLAWVVACVPKEDGSGDIPPLQGDDTSGECTSVPPEITEISVSNGGMIPVEGGEDQPSVRVDVTFLDEDQDIDVVDFHYWWDDVVDGVVDVSGTPQDVTGAFERDENYEACAAPSGSFGRLFGVSGGWFENNTWYDFAVTVTDAHGLVSEPAITSGVTPKADGTDGDPR